MTPNEVQPRGKLRVFTFIMVWVAVVLGAVAMGLLLKDSWTPKAQPTQSSDSIIEVAPRSTPSTPASSPAKTTARQSPTATDTTSAATVPNGIPKTVAGFRHGKQIFNAPLDAIELNAQGYLVPKFDRAGWFAQDGWKSQKPGVPGPSIVAAHVNQLDAQGKVIDDHFARLHTMEVGDKIRVFYDSGDVVEFTVSKSRAVDKVLATDISDPLAKSIWEPGEDKPYLRLFTCDEETSWVDGHYTGNWVVWAEKAVLMPKS